MYRTGSGKGHGLLSARLTIGRLDPAGGIGVPGRALYFDGCRGQFSIGVPDARVSGQLHQLAGRVIRCPLGAFLCPASPLILEPGEEGRR